MKPSGIIQALEILLIVQQPVFLWGAPGVGKSQVVAEVAAKKGLELLDIRAVLLDPVDLRGIPRISPEGTTIWCAPGFLPQEGEGVLFLDELNSAPPLVQAACYQLVLDRKIGEYCLPSGWTVVAAGNRETDRAVTHRMPSALANRMIHLDFETDMNDWQRWAAIRQLDARVRDFLRFRPALLHDFDPARKEKAFPSPRSWEFVARMLGACGEDFTLLQELVAGTVGEAAALEFLAYLRTCDAIPRPDAVLADPEGIALPYEPALLHALCSALAAQASSATISQLATVAERLPVEFGVVLMRDAASKDACIVESAPFQRWAENNAEILVSA